MNSRIALFLTCFVLIIGMATALVWLRYEADSSTAEALVVDEKTEGQQVKVAAPNENSVRVRSYPPGKKSHMDSVSVLEVYNRRKDGRATALELWKYPDRGGRYYAASIVDQCALESGFTEFLKQPQPSEPISDGRTHVKVIEAFDRLQRLCAQFTKEELDSLGGRSVSAGDTADTLVNAERTLINARRSGDLASRRKATDKILSISDPLLIDRLGMSLYTYRDEIGTYIYFDGEKNRVNQAPAIMSALELLPCVLGLDCGNADPQITQNCIFNHECFESRYEKVRRDAQTQGPNRFEEVMNLAERMALAIKQQDFSKFYPAEKHK